MQGQPARPQIEPDQLGRSTQCLAQGRRLFKKTHRRPKGTALGQKDARLLQPGVQAAKGRHQIRRGMEKTLPCLAVIKKEIPPRLQIAQLRRRPQRRHRRQGRPGIPSGHEAHRRQMLQNLLSRSRHGPSLICALRPQPNRVRQLPFLPETTKLLSTEHAVGAAPHYTWVAATGRSYACRGLS